MSNQTNSWLVCIQTSYSCVKYQTSDGVIKYPRYDDFLLMMAKLNVKNPMEFKKNIDTFKVLYVDLLTGDWEKLKDIESSTASFETLLKHNEKIIDKKDIKKSKQNTMVERGKKFIFGRKKDNGK